MKKIRIISFVLSIAMLFSVMSFSSFANEPQNVDLDVWGGANESEGNREGVQAEIDGEKLIFKVSESGMSASESGAWLANFFDKDSPGMMINAQNGEQTLTTVVLSAGELSSSEVVSLIIGFVETPGERELRDIGIFNDDGNVVFNYGTIESIRQIVAPQVIDDTTTMSELLDMADTVLETEFIFVFEIIPFNELDLSTLPPEQLKALQDAIGSGAEIKFFVRSTVYVKNSDGVQYLGNMNWGINTNTVSGVYNEIATQSDNGENTDTEDIYVLHVTEDGKTVTNIDAKERVYDDLIFHTHMTGDFFIVDCPDGAPNAQDEPDAERRPFYYKAQTNTDNLIGATASLSKTEKIEKTNNVTLTITPGAGRKFEKMPVVTARKAFVEELVLQPDGSYACIITNFSVNEIITVTGETVLDEAKKLGSIEIKNEPQSKVYYWSQSPLDTNGIVVEAFYEDGTSAGIIDESMLDYEGFDSFSLGNQTVKVLYNGLEDTFEITVEFDFIEFIKYIFSRIFGFLS